VARRKENDHVVDNFVRNSFHLMGRRFMSQTDAANENENERNGTETDVDDAAHSNCRLTNFYKCDSMCLCVYVCVLLPFELSLSVGMCMCVCVKVRE